MKRIALFLIAMLFLTACSRQAVQDVFRTPGSSMNMLEVQLFDQPINLGVTTASVLDAMYQAGMTVYDYQTMQQFGAGGKYAARDQLIHPKDLDRNKLVYFHSYPSAYWKQYESSQNAVTYGIPQNGIEASIYAFPFWSGEYNGVLAHFTSAEGLTMSSSQSELSDYIYTGVYGMSFSTSERDRSSHYFMVTVDGQPLDLSSYVEALPSSLTDELAGKGSMFVVSSPFVRISPNNEESREQLNNEYVSSQECRNFCAVMNAYYDKIKELNARTVSNITIIDFAFVGGRFDSAAYFVFKPDAFNPR